MCDCYGHKCECCDEIVQMHIADFAFPRENFKVWCKAHIDEAAKGAVVFEVIESFDGADEWDEPVGWKCAILGPDVGVLRGNLPNVAGDMKQYVKR